MARRMAEASTGSHQWTKRLSDQAETYATHAEILRKMIFGEPAIAEEVPLPQASQGQAD